MIYKWYVQKQRVFLWPHDFCWKEQMGMVSYSANLPPTQCNWSFESSYRNFDFLRKKKQSKFTMSKHQPWLGHMQALKQVWLGDACNQRGQPWARNEYDEQAADYQDDYVSRWHLKVSSTHRMMGQLGFWVKLQLAKKTFLAHDDFHTKCS